ncbi:uncharacterized protein LOC131054821 [Cryptomeria japonica]|uniref:uncharacterized protein LOC131054821 n=1 Tax=Cryptomeria japonica TaxID=3369 RepID=UPI0025ACC8F4|nr:uncharacterized protein LOC131054821 [Cryptomeria japonica]
MCCLTGMPLLETVYIIALCRWAWKRCLHTGSEDSKTWGTATFEDFEPVPRMCRLVLAVYEEDLDNPVWAPPGGYQIDIRSVVKRVGNLETSGMAPPYLIYVDHNAKDIILAFRGLSMVRESDYAVLLDNKLGQEKFEGGFVHHGLLKSALCVFEKEAETLRELVGSHPDYNLTFTGHSLGSGVAAMLALKVAGNRDLLGNIPRKQIRCYAIAPARCVSLNLAVRSADIINSVILQDDFMPRTATPLEDMFKCVFCLPCLLCFSCVGDTFTPEDKLLRDPRRLYVPGRLYHIVERKLCRYGRLPPHVKTAVPVDRRFEHVVISCNATTDHSIVCIERESQKALDIMMEERMMNAPIVQKMERQISDKSDHDREHSDAMQRVVSLSVPHASGQLYGTFT